MTFNVWSAENTAAGRSKIVEIIQTANADVIAVQEMGNSAGQSIAGDLGFHYHQQSANDIQVISRFPIVGRTAGNHGVLIEIQPGHQFWLFNAHLPAYPYQPYDLRDGVLPPIESSVVAAAESARGLQIDHVLADMAAALASDYPVLFGGDFNEPSHLDWTQAAADATPRTFDLKIEYPASKKIIEHDLLDSLRILRNDEVNDRAYTWTPGNPPPNTSNNEVHDRIDLLYHHGERVSPVLAQTIGLNASNPNTDIAVAGFNADHRAVLVRYSIAPPVGNSVLTFAGLTHNPGNDNALNEGAYGDRWITTPNVSLEFAAAPNSHWDTYDGDHDNNGANNWNGGVGQLQSGSGSAVYDARFLPDPGFGVILESFDLADYVDFAAGHAVHWELWAGQADTGTLLTEGQEKIQADSINSVLTGQVDAVNGLLTLRIDHLAGDGTDLAIDNIVFRQSPPPATTHPAQFVDAIFGTQLSGGLGQTFNSDDAYLKYSSDGEFTGDSPVLLVFDGTVANSNPQAFGVQIELSANTTGLVTTLEMYNWGSAAFEELQMNGVSLGEDSIWHFDLTDRISDFVHPSKGSVRSRIGLRADGSVLFFPWTVCFDQFVWTTE